MSTEHALPGQYSLPLPLSHSTDDQRLALYRAHRQHVDELFLIPEDPLFADLPSQSLASPPRRDYTQITRIPPTRHDLVRYYDEILTGRRSPPSWAIPVFSTL